MGSGCQGSGTSPGPCVPGPAPLADCQAFKGVCKARWGWGGGGWPGSPESEMGEQKEAAWAGLAGARGGTEGGKGETAEGGPR